MSKPLALAAALILYADAADAGPVEYLRICGTNSYDIPGTDVCLNIASGESQELTAGGTWLSSVPNEPAQRLPNAAAGCIGGALVDLTTIQASDLAANSYGKMESIPLSISLGPNDFLANLMISGGITVPVDALGTIRFTGTDSTLVPSGTEVARTDNVKYMTLSDGVLGSSGVSGQIDVFSLAEVAGLGGLMATGTTLSLVTAVTGVNNSTKAISGFDNALSGSGCDLCMYFRDSTMAYTPLGCADVGALQFQPATVSFAPRRSAPPPGAVGAVSIVAAGRNWNSTSALLGSVTLSACVRNTASTGAACKATAASGATGFTIDCGTTTAGVSNGSNGSTGAVGASGTWCSIADHGDGTATMSCPDGTSNQLLTPAAVTVVKTKASGCNSVGEAHGLLAALAIGLRQLRRQRRRLNTFYEALLMHKRFLLVVAGAMAFCARPAFAVQYVPICSLYGADFYYVPQTAICVNSVTGETREQTLGGTWRSSIPSAPFQWVPNAAAGCLGGTLVDLGSISGANFSVNAFSRYEAAPVSVNLGQGDYIASFTMSGGFSRTPATVGTVEFAGAELTFIPAGTELTRVDNFKYKTTEDGTISGGVADVSAIAEVAGAGGIMAPGTALALVTGVSGVSGVSAVTGFDSVSAAPLVQSDFCLSFRDATGLYLPLGCEDAGALAGQPATISFAPRVAALPPSLVSPVTIVPNGRDWQSTDVVSGAVALSACVRNTSADGAACRVTAAANGATLDCGATTAVIPNGSNGAVGATGAQGSSGAACTLADHGDGTATMTCPDGSSAVLLTQAPVTTTAKKSGCNSTGGGATWLVAALALLLRTKRARAQRRNISCVMRCDADVTASG